MPRKKRWRVEMQPDRCAVPSCTKPATYGCRNVIGDWPYVCDEHRFRGGKCCLPLKVGPIYNSPLMELGSWVYAHNSSIIGAPEDLLLAAYAHVEARMVRCAYGNARARATERWLGRWAKIIDRELEVQRYLAAYERDNFGVVGVALNSAPAGGLVEVELVL